MLTAVRICAARDIAGGVTGQIGLQGLLRNRETIARKSRVFESRARIGSLTQILASIGAGNISGKQFELVTTCKLQRTETSLCSRWEDDLALYNTKRLELAAG